MKRFGQTSFWEWKQKKASISNYKTVVRPILTYAVKIRTDTTKTREILEVCEMKSLRRIAGKTRMDRVKK